MFWTINKDWAIFPTTHDFMHASLFWVKVEVFSLFTRNPSLSDSFWKYSSLLSTGNPTKLFSLKYVDLHIQQKWECFYGILNESKSRDSLFSGLYPSTCTVKFHGPIMNRKGARCLSKLRLHGCTIGMHQFSVLTMVSADTGPNDEHHSQAKWCRMNRYVYQAVSVVSKRFLTSFKKYSSLFKAWTVKISIISYAKWKAYEISWYTRRRPHFFFLMNRLRNA